MSNGDSAVIWTDSKFRHPDFPLSFANKVFVASRIGNVI